MKRIKSIVAVIILILLSLENAQSGKAAQDSTSAAAQDSLSAMVQDSLPVPPVAIQYGEDLTFKIRYGFIKAGIAHMRIKGISDRFNKPLLHIQTTAKNIPAFGWIYTVDDVVNAFVDPQTLVPWYYEKKLREGTYKADLRVHYQHEDSTARVEFVRYKKDMTIRKQKRYPVKIPANVFDVLSAFYYIRTQPLQVGKSLLLNSHSQKKVYDLEVKVHRKEILEVGAGTFHTLVVEPLLKGEGVFKQKGRLLIWLTDDELKIPVQMTSAVAIGHITSELMRISGINGKIPARIK